MQPVLFRTVVVGRVLIVPKVVDHVRRREELADAALTLIARDGLRAVTTRAVADEAGWSTGVLTHYFAGINDVLLAALRRAAELQGRVLRECRGRTDRDARERLCMILESVLPLDDRRVALTRIFLVFYAEVGANPTTRDEVAEYLDNWRRIVARTLTAGIEDGSIVTSREPADVAVELVALADGLAVHAAIDPQMLATLQADPAPGLRILKDFVGIADR